MTTTSAEAQSWLSDRKRTEGNGIRVGDFELHPGIGLELGYLSNVYNAESPEQLGSAGLRIAPHILLSTLGVERSGQEEGAAPGILRLRGGLSATFFHYFAEGTPDTDFGTDLDLQLTLAPERPVSLSLIEHFNRTFRPFVDPVDAPRGNGVTSVDPVQNAPATDFARYQELIGARLTGQTRGGLLLGTLGYQLTYDWFEDQVYDENDNLTHTVDLTGAWTFYPKTALFYDAAYSRQDYTNNEDSSDPRTRAPLTDNDQIRVRLGLNGAISPRISATLALGYAAGFFGGNDYEGLILNLEGRWIPSPISEWGVGFERSYGSAYQGNFAVRNQIYSRLLFFLGGAFVIQNRLSIEFVDFGPDLLQSDQARSDIRYALDVSGEYRFIDWLAATAQLSALIDSTDFVARTQVRLRNGTLQDFADPAEFTSVEFWVGARVFY